MTPYRFTSATRSELSEAISYYEQRENGLGAAFLDEVEATINSILQHPTAWHPFITTNKTLTNSSLSVWSDLPDPY